MKAMAHPRPKARSSWLPLVGLALAALILGALLAHLAPDAWYTAFVVLAGLAVGSLGLLMIGHILGEDWLSPVRDELEAASLTAPLLVVLALPLGFSLDALFPWTAQRAEALPAARQIFLSEGFFLLRSAAYLAIWSVLAIWIVRSDRPRRAGLVGIGILAITVIYAANDWVMSREPAWWSTLFGFAFAVGQLLGALAAAILFTLLSDGGAHPRRLMSLERALLTLALLSLWIWFSQFLIVWLANLPAEAAWYLRRSDDSLALLTYVAGPSLALALVLLLPSGVGRFPMLAGSALLLAYHLAHMLWILHPSAQAVTSMGLMAGGAATLLWAAWFVVQVRRRPDVGALWRQSDEGD